MTDDYSDTGMPVGGFTMDSDPKDWPLEERPLIYVAGYYSADPTGGLHNAIQEAERLIEAGWLPLVPHVTLMWACIVPHDIDFWYTYDLGLLRRCDAMYVCPGKLTEESTGVRNEIVYATKHGIPVFYDVVEAKERYDR